MEAHPAAKQQNERDTLRHVPANEVLLEARASRGSYEEVSPDPQSITQCPIFAVKEAILVPTVLL